MVTIYVPHPSGERIATDRDSWFLESLAEMIQESIEPAGGMVGGFETGPGDTGILLFDVEPSDLEDEVISLLERHCPAGTYLEFHREDETVRDDVFDEEEEPSREPLPVDRPDLAYEEFRVDASGAEIDFHRNDRHIFKAVASMPGISVERIQNVVEMMERMRLSEDELQEGVDRLERAGYIEIDNGVSVAEDIAEKLPRIANGNISSLRSKAWTQFYDALF